MIKDPYNESNSNSQERFDFFREEDQVEYKQINFDSMKKEMESIPSNYNNTSKSYSSNRINYINNQNYNNNANTYNNSQNYNYYNNNNAYNSSNQDSQSNNSNTYNNSQNYNSSSNNNAYNNSSNQYSQSNNANKEKSNTQNNTMNDDLQTYISDLIESNEKLKKENKIKDKRIKDLEERVHSLWTENLMFKNKFYPSRGSSSSTTLVSVNREENKKDNKKDDRPRTISQNTKKSDKLNYNYPKSHNERAQNYINSVNTGFNLPSHDMQIQPDDLIQFDSNLLSIGVANQKRIQDNQNRVRNSLRVNPSSSSSNANTNSNPNTYSSANSNPNPNMQRGSRLDEQLNISRMTYEEVIDLTDKIGYVNKGLTKTEINVKNYNIITI